MDKACKKLGSTGQNLQNSQIIFMNCPYFPTFPQIFLRFSHFSPFETKSSKALCVFRPEVHRDLRGQQGQGRVGGGLRLWGGNRGWPAQVGGDAIGEAMAIGSLGHFSCGDFAYEKWRFFSEGPIDGWFFMVFLGFMFFLNDVMFPMILDFSYKNMGIFPRSTSRWWFFMVRFCLKSCGQSNNQTWI